MFRIRMYSAASLFLTHSVPLLLSPIKLYSFFGCHLHRIECRLDHFHTIPDLLPSIHLLRCLFHTDRCHRIEFSVTNLYRRICFFFFIRSAFSSHLNIGFGFIISCRFLFLLYMKRRFLPGMKNHRLFLNFSNLHSFFTTLKQEPENCSSGSLFLIHKSASNYPALSFPYFVQAHRS